jgi:putative ABC transport system permease protein
MKPHYIEIPYHDLAIAAGFVVLMLILSGIEKLRLEKSLTIGAIRTFVQLMAVGYVLKFIFDLDQWYWVLLMLVVMVLVAARSAAQRVERPVPHLLAIMTGAIFIALAITLTTVAAFVLRLDKWYQPQYIIPIAGMIIGNSMNGAALALDRLGAEVKLRRQEIEAMLSLGATWRQAAQVSLRTAVRASMIPVINQMMVYGVVQLPGMMTGQIIGGVEPVEAVKYQVMVAYMIAGAVAISSILTVNFACRQLFTRAHQLAEAPA